MLMNVKWMMIAIKIQNCLGVTLKQTPMCVLVSNLTLVGMNTFGQLVFNVAVWCDTDADSNVCAGKKLTFVDMNHGIYFVNGTATQCSNL